jgi:hypothetical protein
MNANITEYGYESNRLLIASNITVCESLIALAQELLADRELGHGVDDFKRFDNVSECLILLRQIPKVLPDNIRDYTARVIIFLYGV